MASNPTTPPYNYRAPTSGNTNQSTNSPWGQAAVDYGTAYTGSGPGGYATTGQGATQGNSSYGGVTPGSPGSMYNPMQPWTREFNPSLPGGGSYGGQYDPTGQNGSLDASAPNAGGSPGGGGGGGFGALPGPNWPTYNAQSYNPGASFNYTGPQFTGVNYDPTQMFKYSGQPMTWNGAPDPGKLDPGTFNGGPAFQSNVAAFAPDKYTADRYTAPGAFVAPTAAEALNDPGYQFRVQQGNDAIAKSALAKGSFLSGNTATALADYQQGAASQEYANVYGRRLGEYQTAAQLGQAAYDRNQAAGQGEYDRNYQAGLDTNNIAYQRAASEYDRNFNQGLQTYGANTQAQAQAFQANTAAQQNAAQLNLQGQSAAYDRNYAAQLDAYKMDQAQRQFGAQFALTNQQAVYDRAYKQQLDPYQMDQSNNQFAANFGLQSQNAAYDRNYQAASDAYNRNFQAQQAAFGNGLASSSQAFNQAMDIYNTNRGNYNYNQGTMWDQGAAYDNQVAGGINAANGLGTGYADQYGNYVTNQGNANASGYIAQGNATAGMYQGIGNSVQDAAAIAAYYRNPVPPQAQARPQAPPPYYGAPSYQPSQPPPR